MAYQALARKYRPQSFHDVVGQETLVRTLQHAIEQKRIHHAYLFSGVRGVGKTTSARILAKALNCVDGPTVEPCNQCTPCREITEGIDLDVREIDAATYTGVDNIRELREVTQFQPARDRFRIFIIDEAHMLSTGAWNALLKILEEPPPHVIFMFATTEVHKVPQTILSRVQKFLLRKINLDELITRLEEIARQEGITATRDALEIMARRGEGSVRDSLSLFDQVIAFSGRSISGADVSTVLGLSETNFFARVIELVAAGDHAGVLQALDEAAGSGRDFRMLYRDLLNFVRNLLLIAGGASESALSVSPEDLGTIRSLAASFSYTDLLRIANLLLRDDETVNRAEHQRLAVEVALLKATTFPRLKSVEEAISSGSLAAPGAAASPAPRRPVEQPSQHAERSSSSRTTTTSTRQSRSDAAPPEGVEPLLDRLQKARPLLAGYLGGAKTARKDGNRVIWTFDDPHFAQPLIDARATLEEIARDVYGAPTQVLIETVSDAPGSGRRADDQPSPLREDPVVKAFAKHLGGEVVKEKR